MVDVDPYLPLVTFFPGRSERWAADNARAGRLPGAVRIGRRWMMRASDAARLATPRPPHVPTVDQALADLRARGV